MRAFDLLQYFRKCINHSDDVKLQGNIAISLILYNRTYFP